jgi:signal peptidase I
MSDTAVVAGLLVSVAMTALVSLDAARRGRNWVGWAVLTSIAGPIAVLIWLLVRRRAAVLTRLDVRRGIGVTLGSVLAVLLIVVVRVYVVTFLFQVARVEGQAMSPTLADQDRLMVNKLAYRTHDPQVNDIVMFYYPLRPEKSLVKRIAATEGDEVRIVDGRMSLNGVGVEDSFVLAAFRSHDTWGPQVVPEGYYFVLGDHRNNSSDSRHWGFVPKKYVIGKVQLRWWPLSSARMF